MMPMMPNTSVSPLATRKRSKPYCSEFSVWIRKDAKSMCVLERAAKWDPLRNYEKREKFEGDQSQICPTPLLAKLRHSAMPQKLHFAATRRIRQRLKSHTEYFIFIP